MSYFLIPFSTKVNCRVEFPWNLEDQGSGDNGDGCGPHLLEASHGFWDGKTSKVEEISGEIGCGKD